MLIGSGVVTYLAGIEPLKLSDRAFDALTQKYRLLHLCRTESRTGPGGPGDLAWVWPLATMSLVLVIVPLLLTGRRRRSSISSQKL